MTTDNVSALIVTPEEKELTIPPSSAHNEMENHLEILAQEVAHLRLSLLSETESFQKKTKQLHHRVNSLTVGLLIAVLALVGGGTWLLSSPNALQLIGLTTPTTPNDGSQATDLVPQVGANQGDNSEQLASEMKSIQEKIQALEADQTVVQELNTKVETLVTNSNSRQQTITTLAKALQNVIDIETSNEVPVSSPTEATPNPSSDSEKNQAVDESAPPASSPTTVENSPSSEPKPSSESKNTN